MPLPRIRIRMLMIAVAVVGMGLGGTILVNRYLLLRQTYLRRAALHDVWKAKIFNHPDSPTYWESRWRDQRAGAIGLYPWPDGPPFVPAIAAYHDRMAAKWRSAADHPWVDVEPDPLSSGP